MQPRRRWPRIATGGHELRVSPSISLSAIVPWPTFDEASAFPFILAIIYLCLPSALRSSWCFSGENLESVTATPTYREDSDADSYTHNDVGTFSFELGLMNIIHTAAQTAPGVVLKCSYALSACNRCHGEYPEPSNPLETSTNYIICVSTSPEAIVLCPPG